MLTLSIADRGEYDDRTFQNPIKFKLELSSRVTAAGHSHISTTQRYIDVNSDQLSQAVELL